MLRTIILLYTAGMMVVQFLLTLNWLYNQWLLFCGLLYIMFDLLRPVVGGRPWKITKTRTGKLEFRVTFRLER